MFDTFTQHLERLRDWLKEHKIKQVALESTGVYWIPVWNVLESARWKFELCVVNPQHVRAIPGRKTDQKDADRLSELLQYGWLRGSFIPPQPIRELRDLTRTPGEPARGPQSSDQPFGTFTRVGERKARLCRGSYSAHHPTGGGSGPAHRDRQSLSLSGGRLRRMRRLYHSLRYRHGRDAWPSRG